MNGHFLMRFSPRLQCAKVLAALNRLPMRCRLARICAGLSRYVRTIVALGGLSALLCLSLGLSSSVVFSAEKNPAMEAAREEAGKLNFQGVITESSASGVVPSYGADVSELKDLFSKGQGNLLSPGTQKADGCLSASSMDCRAVQMIYDTHQRPGWNESEFDSALGDRDQLIGSVPDRPSNGEEVCETITTTHPPQTEFATCEETIEASTQNCIEGWTEKLDITTLFECISRTAQKVTVHCFADFVTSNQQYNCLHAPYQTCSVGETVRVDSRYAYQCTSQTFTPKTYRCNQVLKIEGYKGCDAGTFYEASSDVNPQLGKDLCNGGDVIELKYACSNDKVPLLKIETNVKNAANFSFQIQSEDFEVEKYFSNCRGLWRGKTRCAGPNCTTEIQMDIYVNPRSWKYSGSIGKKFAFQTQTSENFREEWVETCVAADGSALEAKP